MTRKTIAEINHEATEIASSIVGTNERVQNLLIEASYHACLGNSDPMNAILAKLEGAKTVKIDCLTRWVEFNLPMIVKEGKFKLTKAWPDMGVTDEATFAKVESELRASPAWHLTGKKEVAKSVWDADTYLNRVIDKLIKEGRPDLAKEVLAIKAHIEQGTKAENPEVATQE